MSITHPWIIVHQPGGIGPVVTILAGPDGSGVDEFAIAVADVIKHLANATGVAQSEVLRRVIEELNNPTSPATRIVDA